MSRTISVLVKIVAAVFFLLGLALAGNALSYFNFDPHYSFLRLKQSAIATGWYLPAYYSHVLVGGLILVAGFVQLSPSFGRRWMSLHRGLGYLYVMGILFFSAPGGLIMSFFIGRGPIVQASFVVQASLWFWFTAMAFDRIRKGDVPAHRQWMWRSFSLTLAAITLRIYIYICSFFVDLSTPLAYGVLSWASWLPNLLIVEACLLRGCQVAKWIRESNQT